MDELYNTFDPLIKSMKFFGYFPFKKDLTGNFRICFLNLAFVVTMFAVFDVLIYLQISHMDSYKLAGSFLSKISTVIVTILTQVFVLITIVMNFVNRRIFGDYLRVLRAVDDEVSIEFLIFGSKFSVLASKFQFRSFLGVPLKLQTHF